MLKKEKKDRYLKLVFPRSLDVELREYSKTSGVPLAEIIRFALTQFLESDREWQKLKKEKMNLGSRG